MVYSWQRELWNQCLANRERLGHALLLHGMRGIGKVQFARELAAAFLCESPTDTGEACGRCPACGWFAQGGHPDCRVLEPESEAGDAEAAEKAEKKGGRYITVAQVRELMDFVTQTTLRGGLRIIIVTPAETMNPAAANALLKTLEEPPPGTLMLLVSHQPQRLLPTIRSRCRMVAMPQPTLEEALALLKDNQVEQPQVALAQAGGAPLEALALSNSEYQAQRQAFLSALSQERLRPLQVAEASLGSGLPWTLGWLYRWVYDLLSLRLCGSVRYHVDFEGRLQVLAKQVNVLALLQCQRELAEAQRLVSHPLNPQLALEQLLVSYARALAQEV